MHTVEKSCNRQIAWHDLQARKHSSEQVSAPLPHGWWILPFIVLGSIIWVVIVWWIVSAFS